MRKVQLILLSLITLIFSACFTTGSNFPSDLAWIKKEQTSQKDVRMVLGDPFAVGNSGGTTTWTYVYYEFKMIGKRSHKELKFYWKDDRTVKHFSFNSSFREDLQGPRSSKSSSIRAQKSKTRNNAQPRPKKASLTPYPKY